MNIISRYIREQKRYSKEDLKQKFNLDEKSFLEFVKELKAFGVLKVVKNTTDQKNLSDLNDVDLEIIDLELNNENYFYVFTFVGILARRNIVLKCFPKYLLTEKEPFEEMRQVLKVLNRYNSKKQIINLYNGYDEQKEFNLLAIILYILHDYQEYGIYNNQQEIIEFNGEGEILWENTINETFAYILNERPIYIEFQTRTTVDNEMDYITRLHKYIITECCQRLKKGQLLDFFGLEDIDISEDDKDFFGSKDYKLYRLERELNIQFISRKRTLLKTMYAYVAHDKLSVYDFGLSMYGTNNFNLVWEDVCAFVFDNKLNTTLNKLKLPQHLHEDYINKSECKLAEIIEKPIWIPLNNGNNPPHKSDTLKPDLISIYEIENGVCFGIFDAKYYNIVLEKDKLQNQPGVQDITKQYLYQLAYNDFIKKHGFAKVKNLFLMPSEYNHSKKIGEVKMNIFEELSNPSLVNISVVKLSANKIFKYYLASKKFEKYKEFDFLN